MKKTSLILMLLLMTGTLSFAQTVLDLTGQSSPKVAMTAQRSSVTMPDGKIVPMWSYVCTSSGLATDPCSTIPAGWAPGPTIVVKPGSLEIDLTNALPTPTSIVVLGQIGGGLGSPNKIPSPAHQGQTLTTWPASSDGSFTPPVQANRVMSFGTEVGINSTAQYNWTNLKPGTYLYETGTHPSIQAPMGLYGVLVVTNEPQASPFAPGKAHLGAFPTGGSSLADVPYDADQVLLISEIDPVQNAATDTANGDESQYPHAVDYKPLYFLVNGKAFDRSAPSMLPVGASSASGNVLLRFVNAGLKTHIPSTVGLPMSVVAEDGNVLPGVPKVQSELLLTAGKTLDAIVHPPVTTDPTTQISTYNANVFPVFDRQLSLSNNNHADGGIQAYLQVAGGQLGNSGLAGPMSAQVIDDAFALPANATTFTNNVLTNDIGITTATLVAQPQFGSVTMNADGTFTYTPTPSGSNIVNDSFQYYGNGNSAMVATVKLSVTAVGAPPTAGSHTFVSNLQSMIKVPAPGILAFANDPSNYKLSAAPAGAGQTAGQQFTVDGANQTVVTLNADGSIVATTLAPPPYSTSFTYVAINAQGQSSASGTITLQFPKGNGPKVTVQDAQASSTTLDDYKWTIEQDTTWPADPTQGLAATTGTPDQSLGTNFHKSYMPVIATGCTGPLSCGDSQSVGGNQVAPAPRSYPQDAVLPIDTTPNSTNNRFYVSILPGDAGGGGHTIGGSSFAGENANVTVKAEPQPLQTAQLSVFIFEDNNPTNGDADDGEPGLGGFQITLMDVRASTGDPAGQITYDAYGMPLSNALLGQPDCPGSVPPGTPTGVIITCPDGSPLAGMALIKNLMPLRYDVTANVGAAREGKGEKWYQVSTLEGTFAQDAFAKVGEPTYFQEFGAPGFHSFIGFINPDHIAAVNKAQNGTYTVQGKVTNLHMDRPPKINLWDSGTRDALNFTTCFVGLNAGGGTGANIAFAQCDPSTGAFSLTGIPAGTYSLVVWDQWLDQIIAYKSVNVPDATAPNSQIVDVKDVAVFSWFTQLNQSAYLDLNQNGLRDSGEPGISQIPMTIRFRDGSISNLLTTDSDGSANFDQLFPLFNWYVTESDTTRFKGSKVAVAADNGGPVSCDSNTAQNTSQPGTNPAFCNGPYKDVYNGILNPQDPTSANLDGGVGPRLDDGSVLYEGVQGFISQTNVIDWGKIPYVAGETGGIKGMVYYASTRGFDDPRLEVQFTWEPAVPRVPVNLYQEVVNADGTTSLKLVDSTTTNSWDDNVANLHCPGQDPNDPFVQYTIGSSNVDKCYDGMHNFNQVQPAVYDGRYRFPTAACTICTTNPANTDPSNVNHFVYPNVLPAGKYVVEIVPPAGYEIVKEEDKNILIGDQWIAPVTQQFGSLGNLFILPDQATLDESVIPTTANTFPACVGDAHIVPDFLSLYPDAQQYSPFAGASRNLCNRKEVQLEDQMQANADFQVFTPAPIAAHFTGMMLNDAAAEFNQVSPSFGEKEALPNAPVSIKDFNGVEIQRVYTDKWGQFNGLTPSTWEANVPNPSGYSPNMLITCMNDPGPIPDPNNPGKFITDPMYNPMYSNFCYTWPFMPGITTYLDTPVLPVAAFAAKYNPVDCAYPDGTPAIKEVNGNGQFGPYLDKAQPMTLTITALGQAQVANPAYSGPQNFGGGASNNSLVPRDFGFGNTPGKVMLGSIAIDPATINWSANSISFTVPSTFAAGEYQLSITRGDNNLTSVDTVTVTIDDSTRAGYRAPIYVKPVTDATATSLATPIQDAIDAANPGDLILLAPGSYPELVIMWKPVRLQGVGAPSVTINATKYPTQKLEGWRKKINSLFGIDAQGNQTLPAVVDPLPGQEITGGAIQLEPSVLSTEEGAGITVLGKQDTVSNFNRPVYGPNSYGNHPSRIDGVSVTGGDSGGGIYVNGWATNLEISNNRVYGNAGTYNGGIRIGQPYLEGLTGGGPFNYDANVKIHHNSVTTNGTVEANAAAGTTAAASAGAGGGVSICTGTDNYVVNYNFICGNFSSGDGGGLAHFGLSRNGVISNNKILFNQSYNQTSPTNGGGLAIEGEPPTGAGLSLGTGEVVVDSNLIQGNFAQSGSGGGIRLQYVNGAEVSRFNAGYKVTVTNNIVADNVAGYAGGGISMVDAVNTSIINNTIVSNDSTGIAGAVINTKGAGPMTGIPSPAGVATDITSPALLAATGVRNPGPAPTKRPNETQNAFNLRLAQWQSQENTYLAKALSAPVSLINDVIWQNRSFFFDGSVNNTAKLCASNNVADANGATVNCQQLPDNPTYACNLQNTAFWDLGTVGDLSASAPQYNLNPKYSVLTDTTLYPGTVNVNNVPTVTNSKNDPGFVKQYCNGPRTSFGQYWEPQQPFLPSPNMQVSATLDEAGNYVSLSYGPLSQTDGSNALFADYHIAGTSSAAYNKGTAGSSSLGYPPNNDYDNQTRPVATLFDIGADEYAQSGMTLSPAVLNFGTVATGTTSMAQAVTVTNNQATAVTYNPALTGNGQFKIAGTTCSTTIAANGGTCVINVVFTPTSGGLDAKTGALTLGGETVALSGTRTYLAVSISPAVVDFGGVELNTTSSPTTVYVTNNGAAATSIAVSGITGSFSRGAGCNGSLAAGATCSLPVTFAPGNSTAQQTVNAVFVDLAGIRQTVPLTGHGVMPQLYLTPANLLFGDVPVNTVSAPQIVNVTNTGTTPLILNTIGITGNYKIAAAGTSCSANFALNANDTCTIAVTFNPAGTTTTQTGILTVASSVGSKTVALRGTRVAGTVTATPNQVDFGTVLVNTASAPQSVTLTNMANTSANVTLGGLPATIKSTACPTLAPKAHCTISLTFTPANTNQVSATMTVNGIGLVSMTGKGTAAILSPSSLTFAAQPIYNASAAQTLTLTNGTNAALPVGTVSFSGANPDSFTRSGGTCAASLAANSSCTIQVTFSPTSTDAQSATLTVAGQTAALSGAGKYLVVSASSLNFAATVGGGNPPAQTLTVTNKGNTAVTGIAIASSNPAFAVTSDCINLVSGASCTVSITYNNPGSASTTNGTLAITYDQVTSTPESVSLTGVTQ